MAFKFTRKGKMKLSKQVKEVIYFKIVNTLNIKKARQFAEELQVDIDKEQDQKFVKFYKGVLKQMQGQRLTFASHVGCRLQNYTYNLFVDADFYKSERFKELVGNTQKEIHQIEIDLKQLKETILSVDTDKTFLTMFPQWEKQLLDSLPKNKMKLPATVADVSYLDKYKKQGE